MNEVEIIITASNRTERAFREAQRDAKKLERDLNDVGVTGDASLGKVDTDAKKLGDSVRKAGEQVEKSLAGSFDDVTDRVHGTSVGMVTLDREIQRVRTDVERMRDEFHRTGDLTLLGGIKRGEADLKGLMAHLMNFRKATEGAARRAGRSEAEELLGGIGDALAGGGAVLGRGLSQGLTTAFRTATSMPVLIGALIGGLAVAGHYAGIVLGGAINAAMLSVVGAGVLAGGIVAAAHSRKVQAAWGEFADTAGNKLVDASQVLVKPLVASAKAFQKAFNTTSIQKDFETLIPVIDDLTQGLIGFAQQAMPGIDAAVGASVKVLHQFGIELPGIGGALSWMLEAFARGVDGAIEGMKILASVVRGTFDLAGWLIEGASNKLVKLDEFFRTHITHIYDSVAGVAEGAIRAFDGTKEAIKDGLGGARDAISNLAIPENTMEAFRKLAKSYLPEIRDALDSINKRLDDNRKGFHGVADAIERLLNLATGLGDAFGPALTVLGSAKGSIFLVTLSIDEMIQTIGGIGLAWEKVKGPFAAVLRFMANTFLNFVGFMLQAAVTAFGWIPGIGPKLHAAAKEFETFAARVNNAIDGITSVKNVNLYVTEHFGIIDTAQRGGERSSTGRAVSATKSISGNNQRFFASGGIVGAAAGGARGAWTWVGEQGRELVKLPYGSQVYPHGQSENMAAAAAADRGSGGARVWLDTAGAEDDIKRLLRKWVRIDGGGSVQTAFGNGS